MDSHKIGRCGRYKSMNLRKMARLRQYGDGRDHLPLNFRLDFLDLEVKEITDHCANSVKQVHYGAVRSVRRR